MQMLCELIDNSPSYSATSVADVVSLCANFGQSCIDYYIRCQSYVPAPADSVAAGGAIELTPQTIDSVMVAFNHGFLGGLLTMLPAVGGALAIIIVAHLFSYAVSKT